MAGLKAGRSEPLLRDTVEADSQWGRTQCPYCGVGCGLLVQIQDGQAVRVKGDPDHPANFGEVCAKAIMLPRALHTPDRLLYPQVRLRRDRPLARVPWSLALKTVTRAFRNIIAQHGPDAVAFYGSGQLLTEDYYVANKLAKGFLGTNNFDSNSRLCMASAAAGYQRSLGSDGPPAAYADLELTDCCFIIGSNTAECHPIVFRRLKRRKEHAPEEVKVIVVDPRRTETADIADLHLPIRPGADVALLNAMLAVLLEEGLVDRAFMAAHTQGWEALEAVLARYAPEAVQEVCGLSARRIREAALLFGRARNALSLWSMGVNQSRIGVQKNQAIINLHLATGQIGKPGAGPFSLTGQPNAMGGREVGGLAHLLPGYRSVLNPEHRAEAAALWRIPPGHLSPQPGYTAVELFHALVEGKVKAIWIMGTNPAVSMPDLDLVEKGLRQAELVVVQDAYHPTDTTQFADVLLPAAQWPEKEGVMTNSERTLTYLPRLTEPLGEALPDWQILTCVARELGFGEAFPFTCAEDIFEEFKRFTQGRPMDITGLDYARLKRGPVQWPCPQPEHPGTPRLYTDRRFATPDGRARFTPVEHADPAERPSREYPLVLTTGRVKNQWHTMTRTGKVENLLRSCREPFVQLHPQDARRWGIQDGDFVELTSRRGKFMAQARVTAEIAPGTCFVPFHWGRSMGFYKCANNLTLDAFDPVSKEPELKAAAVRVKRLEGCAMNKIEQLKAEKDGLEIVKEIPEFAHQGWEAISEGDLERLKWSGLFFRKHTPGFFMMRVRITSGITDATQLRTLAAIAAEFGRGRLDITTRQQIQLRWLRIEDIPTIVARLTQVGLNSLQTGMDNIRNVVGCPVAGLTSTELLDASPMARQLTAMFVGDKSFTNLPRKFNVTITGCRENCVHAETQDLALVPATRSSDGAEVKGFNVLVGGKLGSGGYRIASPLDLFIAPEEAAELCRAIILTYRDHGPREARNKARLAFLLEQWGTAKFRAEVEGMLGRSLPPAGVDARRDRSTDHVGIFRQREHGLNYVGLAVPVGRLDSEHLLGVCRLAERYGTGEIRLTPGQNLVIPHVPDQQIGELTTETLLQVLRYDPPALVRGLVSCTGIEFCNLAVIETKQRALSIAQALEQKLGAIKPLTIAWSGCPAGCGNHHVADIGLLGSKTRVDGKAVDAVTIFVGGKTGKGARLAEKIMEDVPCDRLPAVLEQLVQYYPRKSPA